MFDDEVVQQEVPETPEAQTESTPEVAQVAPQKQVDDSIARNMRALREKAERIERERDEAIRRLKEFEASRGSAAEEEDPRVGADDIVEGKHLSKYDKKIKKLEAELETQRQQAVMLAAEARLKAQYNDFDKVVSKDNIDKLRELYPEIASTLNTSTDLYATGVSAYTMIKKLGVHVEDEYQNEKAVALKNAAKPKPLTSISPQQGDSPLSKANAFANGLTDELKEQLRREMFEARRAH